MKFLMVSDTHGLSVSHKIYSHVNPDVAFHLGDSQLGFTDFDLEKFIKVKGNCDFDQKYELHKLIDYDHFRILLTHGHYFDVGYSYDRLVDKAHELDAQVVVHGHTHVLDYQCVDGVHIINPGAINKSRSEYPNSYGVLEYVNNSFVVSYYAYPSHQEIYNLKIEL